MTAAAPRACLVHARNQKCSCRTKHDMHSLAHETFLDADPMNGLICNLQISARHMWLYDRRDESTVPQDVAKALAMFDKTQRRSVVCVRRSAFLMVSIETQWPPNSVGEMIACERAGLVPAARLAGDKTLVVSVIHSAAGREKANHAIRENFERIVAVEADRG